MLQAFRDGRFTLLWLATLSASFGGQALGFALSVHVYQQTGSALAAGLMVVVSTLPGVLFGSFAGVVVDRFDRRRVMLTVNALRVPLVAVLLLVRAEEQFWLIYLVAFLQATLMQLFTPAELALIPRLVPPERLAAANAANSVALNLTRLLAPALGGTLIAVLGFAPAVLLGAACFLVAALLIAAIQLPEGGMSVAVQTQGWGTQWREGLLEVKRNVVARTLMLGYALDALKEGALNALFGAFVLGVLGASAQQLGLIVSVQAFGGMVAGLVVPRIITRRSPRLVIGLGFALNGLFLLTLFLAPSLTTALVLFAVTGLPITAAYVGAGTLLQQAVADERRGRVFGTLGTVQSAFLLLSASLGAVLGDRLGVTRVLAGAALFDVAAGVAVLLLLRAVQPTVVRGTPESTR